MANYLFNCNSVTIYSDGDLKAYTELPVGTYTVHIEQNQPIRLIRQPDFSIPDTLYGNVSERTEHIFKTFEERKSSTGVLFVGVKGSGKTMQARHLSRYMAEKGYPTIIVPFSLICQDVADFIEKIDTPSLVLFDEVDKVSSNRCIETESYDSDAENKTNSLLSLFDGLSTTKKLFVLTANSIWRVNQHILNRPGRIYYRFDFDNLCEEFIRQFLDKNLDNKEYVEDIVSLSFMIEDFSFDILKTICEECNRFKCNPKDVIGYLNIRPEVDRYYTFEVTNKSGNICKPINQEAVRIKITDTFAETRFDFFDEEYGKEYMKNWSDIKKEEYANSNEEDRKDMFLHASSNYVCVHDAAFTSIQGGTIFYKVDGYTVKCTPKDIRYNNSWGRLGAF